MYTVEQMNWKLQKIRDLRAKESELSMQKKQVADELAIEEADMMQMLQELGMKSYRGPAGMATLTIKSSVRTPKSPQDREAFFSYLKDKGLYDDMISVNSVTLNSYYKNLQKEYEERGEEMPKIPGLNEITDKPSLSFKQ